MALTFDEIKKAQTQPGFNLAQAAQAATVPISRIDTTQPVPVNNLNSAGLTVNPPAQESSPDNITAGVALNQDYFTKLYQDFTAQQQKQQEEQTSLMNILKTDYAKMAEEGTFQQQQESNLGVPEMFKNLNELNLQIADLSGAYDKEFARTETKGIQSGTPAVFFQGEQAAIQRQKSIEIGTLGVRQAALTGNLQLAQQRAASITNMQFKGVENRIKQTLQFLDINRDRMTLTEKRQADALSIALQFQEKQLAAQKEIRNMALTSAVTQPFFMKVGDSTVYRTSDGYGFTSEQDFLSKGGNFSKIQTINPAESSQVQNLMKDYGDAGILPSDSLAVATQKVKTQSRIYQDKVRGPVGAGGGGVASTGFKDAKIESSVREDAVALIYDQGLSKDDAYKRLRQLYSPQEVSDDALRQLLEMGATSGSTPSAATLLKPEIKIIDSGNFQSSTSASLLSFGGTPEQTTNLLTDFLFKK